MNCSRYWGQGRCGTFTTTTANCGKSLRAREADSPKSWSRVSRHRKPASTAALTRSPFDRAFHPRFPAVSQEILKPARTATRCTSMLASSSHMEGVGQLRGDLQNFGQGLTRQAAIERLVYVIERHAANHAFEDERRPAWYRESPASRQGVGNRLRSIDTPCTLPAASATLRPLPFPIVEQPGGRPGKNGTRWDSGSRCL